MILLSILLCYLFLVRGAPSEGDNEGQIWAVLVAGSNDYENYRHQADVCHAYQIFHRHGIPDTNIVVMMYDDIAYNEDNPIKGVIFNKPGGPNVFGPKEVPKDYIQDQVSPENFIHVLTGNSTGVQGVGSGKVLKSGPDDHVFVYFTDHGATGLVAFPHGLLFADDLINALKTMHNEKMYKKLVFYMEACESGSMFDKILPHNINIIATTAANTDESSYACYWDETVKAYLGDEFSVAWMEDVDSEEQQKNITTETLKKQFQNVVKRVTLSHPQMYGEKKYQKDHVKDYVGASQNESTYRKELRKIKRDKDAVSARDVLLHTLNRKFQNADSTEELKLLQKKRDALLKGRNDVDKLFARILSHVTNSDGDDLKALEQEHEPLSLEMMPCYKTLVKSFNNDCININENTYVLGHLYKFANLCATEYTDVDSILEAFKAECDTNYQTMNGIH